MASTSHLGITLLEQSQAQKEITINEALARIDAVLNAGVIDRDLASPPGSPVDGALYIVGLSPTGAWVGKAGQVTYFDQIWRFIEPKEGLTLWVNDEDLQVVYDGAGWQVVASGGGGGGGGVGGANDFGTVVEGRITLSTGVPITSGDVVNATTLYFTPYQGNRIALYNGSTWDLLSFSELSLSVPSTTNTVYDVWAYNNSGTVALEVTAWTNDTTRATALVLQHGVYCKSGATTRRYLGSFRTADVAGRTEDSSSKRYVWNYYHRAKRLMKTNETAVSWAYSTSTWRQANGNSANKVEFVRGVNEDVVSASISVSVINSMATLRPVGTGIGFNTLTGVVGRYAQDSVNNTGYRTLIAFYDGMPVPGRHYLSWNEYGGAVDTQTWSGNGFFGLSGHVWG